MITAWTLTVAGAFTVLAVAHSVLGEREVLRPLLAQRWSIGLPRRATERLVRFAWHLTSVAWLGLAALAVGLEPLAVAGVVAVASAAMIGLLLPAHFAWPVFLVGGFAAGVETGVIGDAALSGSGWVGVGVLVVAAALHVYWAAGGRWSLTAAVPTTPDGRPVFTPPAWLTAAVAVALAVQAAAAASLLAAPGPPVAVTWLVAVGVAVLALRAVGDGRYSGFTKSVRSTAFARHDDRLFTPVVVLLALTGMSALLA